MKCKNCKNLGYGYDEGTFFGWCEKTLDSPDEKTDRDCRFFQQKTNADRIRDMSDDELSEQLVIDVDGLQPCRMYLSAPTGKIYLSRAEAVKATKDWLQQPAEED